MQKLFINGQWSNADLREVKVIQGQAEAIAKLEVAGIEMEEYPNGTIGIATGRTTNGFRVYKILEDKSTGKRYFGIYNQRIDEKVIEVQDKIYNVSQNLPNVVNIYFLDSYLAITEFVKYYPIIITTTCNFYGEETYIERMQDHYRKFKMPTTDAILGEHNLSHLQVDTDYEQARQNLYDNAIQTYIKFHEMTNCFFGDIDPNNILVNDDFSDFKIIDVASIKYGDNINISGHQPFPVPIDRIIGPVPSYKYLHSI